MGSGVAVLAVVVPLGPAAAGTGQGGAFQVTVADHQWQSYGCTQVPVSVVADVPEGLPWSLGLLGGPAGRSPAGRVAVSGAGSTTRTAQLRLCPSDSDGTWSLTATGQVFVFSTQFPVPLSVTRVGTTARIDRLRSRAGVLRVRGTVRTAGENPFAGRAAINVSVRASGRWRPLGVTAVRSDGRFTFVSARRVVDGQRVRIQYTGDPVTLPSVAELVYAAP